MPFKKRVITLSAIVGVLLAVYIATFVFSSNNRGRRSAVWTPLSDTYAKQALFIEIEGEEDVILEKTGTVWSARVENTAFPARQARVEDFLAALSKKAEYPAIASGDGAWETMGAGGAAVKVLIKDANITLAELYFGEKDATGRNIYIRSANVIRSGADIFSPYLGARKGWFDLNLFPNREENALTVDSVQRLVVTPPGTDSASGAAYTLLRAEDGWQFENGEMADKNAVDSAVRYMLDASAEDFVMPSTALSLNPGITRASVLLETGDGSRITVTMGQRLNDRNIVRVSGSESFFIISDYTTGRIWRSKEDLKVR